MAKRAAIAVLLIAAGLATATSRAESPARDVSSHTECAWLDRVSFLGLAALATAATWDVDEDGVFAGRLETSPLEGVIDFGNTWGDGRVIGGGATAVFVAGALGGDPGAKRLGADLMRSYALSGVTTLALKGAVDRRRPTGGRYSFPSGHTSSAFSIVPALHHHLGWRASAPALGLGVITALGRLQDRHHYLSDVIFGAAVGWAAGDLALRAWGTDAGGGRLALAPGAAGFAARF